VSATQFSGVDLYKTDPDRAVFPNFHDGGALREMMVVRWDKWKLGYFADPAKGGKALGGVEEILAKEILDDTPADSR
jgi:hypothetical protein